MAHYFGILYLPKNFISLKHRMPNKCCIVGCKGNYNNLHRRTVFKIPTNEPDRSAWLCSLPKRSDCDGKPFKYGSNCYICVIHWPGFPEKVNHKKVVGGKLVPTVPPFHFPGIPQSCLPIPLHLRTVSSIEEKQLQCFNKVDIISNFDSLSCKEIERRIPGVLVKKSKESNVMSLFVVNGDIILGLVKLTKQQMTFCDIEICGKDAMGNKISLSHCVASNNQLQRWSQLEAAINAIRNHKSTVVQNLQKAKEYVEAAYEEDNNEKLKFIMHQIDLHISKRYCVDDYVFASQAFPHITYDCLREVLVLPATSKMRSLKGGVTTDILIKKTLEHANIPQQRICILLIDEVKVRSRLIFTGHVIHGYAEDIPNKKARSVLCIMMRCLHGGRSCMVSMTPLHTLTAKFQKTKFDEAINLVHSYGGHVIGLITDGLRGNQLFMQMLNGYNDTVPWVVPHPLVSNSPLFIINDSVHILKNIRNNWVTEKNKFLSLDGGETVGKWSDIENMYHKDKDSVLKLTPLTNAAVYPTPIQRQNVSLALKVFNNKTIAALEQFGGDHAKGTVIVLKTVLSWWKIVNVKSVTEATRFNDSLRQAVTSLHCEALQTLRQFSEQCHLLNCRNGSQRDKCLTIDTNFALWRSSMGLAALASELIQNHRFNYVLLGTLQSDRLEGEFGCYRSMNGSNYFMTVKDVDSAFKGRGLQLLSKLGEITNISKIQHSCHDCKDSSTEQFEYALDTLCYKLSHLTKYQISASVYVAGYLCKVTPEISLEGELVPLEESQFTMLVSRGFLLIPTQNLATWVQLCMIFADVVSIRCQKQLSLITAEIAFLYDIKPLPPDSACMRLANVLLAGLQNRDFDLSERTNPTSYPGMNIKLARISGQWQIK